MTEERYKTKNLLGQIWRWFKGQIVQEVPDEDALCEFDCRKGKCSMDEWETCGRRLHRAAGELMPLRDSSIKDEKCMINKQA